MPKYSFLDAMGQRGRGNPAALQSLFDRNGIPINLKTNEGLQTIVSYDRTRVHLPYSEVQSELSKLDERLGVDDLMVNMHSVGRRGVLISKPGESSPRMISYNTETRQYDLSDPIDTISEPRKPGWFASLMHNIFGAYKDEFDAYDAQMELYERVTALKATMGYQETMEKLETDENHMYEAKRTAVREKAAKEKEIQQVKEELREAREANQARLDEAFDREKHYKIMDEQLDGMFKPIEDAGLGPRMDYISIDGCTLHSLIYQEYAKEAMAAGEKDINNGGKFAEYCAKHPNRGNEIILAAFANGKRVDCYLPDPKSGICPEHPTKLEPDQRLANVLRTYDNALPELPAYKDSTERFGRLQQVGKNTKLMASYRASQNLSIIGAKAKETMFGTADTAKFKNPLGLSTSRSALVSMTYLALANAHPEIPVQDLFDPTKYLEEKREMGKLVKEKCEAGDAKWFAEQEISGRERVAKEIFAKLDTMKLDSAADLIADENRWVCAACNTLFDVDQEERHFKKAIEDYIAGSPEPEKMKARHEWVCNAANGVCSLVIEAAKAPYDNAQLRNGFMEVRGASPSTTEVKNGFCFEYLKQYKANHPQGFEAGASDKEFGLAMKLGGAVSMNETLFAACIYENKKDLQKDNEYHMNLSDSIVNGRLFKHFKLKLDENGMAEIESQTKEAQSSKIQEKIKESSSLGMAAS